MKKCAPSSYSNPGRVPWERAVSALLVWLSAGGALVACEVQAPSGSGDDPALAGGGGVRSEWPLGQGGMGAGGAGGVAHRPLSSCPVGTFDADPEDGVSCLAWSNCRPGEYIAAVGSSAFDRSCKACPRGTFSESMNAIECERYVACEAGEFVLEAGTKVETQVCDSCEAGSFSSKENSKTCEACPEGAFVDHDGAKACAPWTRCGFSEGIATPGSATSDVVCEVQSGSRQFGSEADDAATSVVLDAEGNIYVAGNTAGDLEGANFGKGDGFVRKYNSAGQVLWTRQIGTRQSDVLSAIALGPEGQLFGVGYTLGTFSDQPVLGGSDAFLIQLRPDGSEVWVRQFGTAEIDTALGLTVAEGGEVFVAGKTYGELNGAPNAGNADAFVVKFSAEGSPLWTHEFGLGQDDEALGVVLSSDEDVYVIGNVDGHFPNADAFGNVDAFLRKLDPDGGEIWTVQFGSTGMDRAQAVVPDDAGNAFVVGSVANTLPGRKSAGARDWFVRKYRGDGSILGTVQRGSSADDSATSVALGSAGEVIVAGIVAAALPGQEAFGETDGFVSVWSSDLKQETFVRQLGSPQKDQLASVASGPESTLFVVGGTSGQLPGQPRLGALDVFLTLVNLSN
jgi:hypothetical protein